MSKLLDRSIVQEMAPRVLSQTGAHYRKSAISENHDAPGSLRGGDRIPDESGDTKLADGTTAQLYDLLDPNGFTLLVVLNSGASDLDKRLQPWGPTIRQLAWMSSPDGPLAAFGDQPSLALVRPVTYAAVTTGAHGLLRIID